MSPRSLEQTEVFIATLGARAMAGDNALEPIAERVSAWLARPTKRTAIVDLPELHASIGTTIGEVRSENQDRAIIVRFTSSRASKHSFIACAVADGMGGMTSGARCAEIALGTFIEKLVRDGSATSESKARAAVEAANYQVYSEFRGRGGTTLVALIFSKYEAVGVSAGDSRLYALSSSGDLRQISTDDTIGGEVKRLTGAQPVEDQTDSFAAQLVQYVGMGDGIQPRMYAANLVCENVKYFLSSDGAHSIDPDTLGRVLVRAASLYNAASRTLQLSNWCGGKDNASMICVDRKTDSTLTVQSRSQPALLEIWDSFAKLELFIGPTLLERTPTRPLREVISEPREYQPTPRGRGFPSQKGGATTKRQKGPQAKGGKRPPSSQVESPQRPLEIEIVDSGAPGDDQPASSKSPNTSLTPQSDAPNGKSDDAPKKRDS